MPDLSFCRKIIDQSRHLRNPDPQSRLAFSQAVAALCPPKSPQSFPAPAGAKACSPDAQTLLPKILHQKYDPAFLIEYAGLLAAGSVAFCSNDIALRLNAAGRSKFCERAGEPGACAINAMDPSQFVDFCSKIARAPADWRDIEELGDISPALLCFSIAKWAPSPERAQASAAFMLTLAKAGCSASLASLTANDLMLGARSSCPAWIILLSLTAFDACAPADCKGPKAFTKKWFDSFPPASGWLQTRSAASPLIDWCDLHMETPLNENFTQGLLILFEHFKKAALRPDPLGRNVAYYLNALIGARADSPSEKNLAEKAFATLCSRGMNPEHIIPTDPYLWANSSVVQACIEKKRLARRIRAPKPRPGQESALPADDKNKGSKSL